MLIFYITDTDSYVYVYTVANNSISYVENTETELTLASPSRSLQDLFPLQQLQPTTQHDVIIV